MISGGVILYVGRKNKRESTIHAGAGDMHDLLLIGGDTGGQHLHGPLQVLLLQHISNPHLVDALARGFIEGSAGGKHDGIPMVVKLLQKPFLEFVGIVHRKAGHYIERAHGFLYHDAGDLPQTGNDRISAPLIFGLALSEEFGTNGIQSSGTQLVNGGNGQTGLAEFQNGGLDRKSVV